MPYSYQPAAQVLQMKVLPPGPSMADNFTANQDPRPTTGLKRPTEMVNELGKRLRKNSPHPRLLKSENLFADKRRVYVNESDDFMEEDSL